MGLERSGAKVPGAQLSRPDSPLLERQAAQGSIRKDSVFADQEHGCSHDVRRRPGAWTADEKVAVFAGAQIPSPPSEAVAHG